MFIPENMMYPVESSNDIPANSWLNWNNKTHDKLKMKEQNALALLYLHEKNNDKSRYKRYFDSLN
jgi:hypothetical protein